MAAETVRGSPVWAYGLLTGALGRQPLPRPQGERKRMDDYDPPLGEVDFVAFDLETTGLTPTSCRIVEFGAVRFRLGSGELGSMSQLVDPQCTIPLGVIRIHGITDAMVRGQPTVRAVMPQFLAFLGDNRTVLLAHNAPFDLAFLGEALAQLGRAELPHAVIDTLDLARRCLGQLLRHDLQSVAWYFGVTQREDHRALADARMAMHVFCRILATRPEVSRLSHLFRLSPPLRLVAKSVQSVSTRDMDALRLAIEECRVIEMVYDGGTRGPLPRRVTPLEIYESGGRAYLVAYCHIDQMEKIFRVDRIRHFELGEEGPPMDIVVS